MTLSRDSILAAVREKPDRLTNKDLARALGVKGDDRRELRAMLKDMVESETLVISSRKTYRETSDFPGVMVIKVTGLDEHGEMIGEPETWKGTGTRPQVVVREEGGSKKSKGHKSASVGVGSRALCRIKRKDDLVIGVVLKRLGSGPQQSLGILIQTARGWSIQPIDKKARDSYRPNKVPEGTENNTLVSYQRGRKQDRGGSRNATIIEILGSASDPKAASMISLQEHNIPLGFDDDVIKEAKALKLPKLDKYREDLRKLPLITIDPVDAKDFDDAIFAQRDEDNRNKGGWIVWVAIADVAAFVTPGSALDKTAREKGNSVYLPDRVEPMLPHELSSDLCSLRPREDRACMAVMMRFRADGSKLSHKFHRGLMRSHARLTYNQAQEAFEGNPGATAETVIDILKDIWDAYQCMSKARKQRAPLAINMPERRVNLTETGEVKSITVRPSLPANKLIEEYMVMANVAAAEALGSKGVTTIVRVHEPPKHEKLQGLSDFLPAMGLKWSLGEKASTKRFNKLLAAAEEKDLSEAIGMSVLRSQSQAVYSPDGKGHFGLNLTDYAHFTSPIRRYADLVVHRALIKAFRLGEDGTSDSENVRLKEIAEHISDTERRAMAAERDAKDRYIAAYLEDKIGAEFPARINGVTKFGLFITLDETGADGLITARSLGDEYFVFDEKKKSLIGADTGGTYRFGQKVNARLIECSPITGGMIFDMLTKPEKGPKPKRNKGNYQGGGGRSHRKGGYKGRRK